MLLKFSYSHVSKTKCKRSNTNYQQKCQFDSENIPMAASYNGFERLNFTNATDFDKLPTFLQQFRRRIFLKFLLNL